MKLALGTAQFGLSYGVANRNGKVAQPQIKNILAESLSCGIDTIDTASAYGDSEFNLGNAGVSKFKIISKLPEIPLGEKNISCWAQTQINYSLTNLKVNSIYALLLHRPSQLLDSRGWEIYQALRDLKSRGLVKKIGISVYSPYELDLLIPKYAFDIVQSPLNLFDRRLMNSGWAERLKRMGIEIHIRSVFLQGLLLMKRDEIPMKFEKWSLSFDRWHNWLKTFNINPISACLAYPSSLVEIDRIIIGVDTHSQLMQILLSLKHSNDFLFPEFNIKDHRLINPNCWSSL